MYVDFEQSRVFSSKTPIGHNLARLQSCVFPRLSAMLTTAGAIVSSAARWWIHKHNGLCSNEERQTALSVLKTQIYQHSNIQKGVNKYSEAAKKPIDKVGTVYSQSEECRWTNGDTIKKQPEDHGCQYAPIPILLLVTQNTQRVGPLQWFAVPGWCFWQLAELGHRAMVCVFIQIHYALYHYGHERH